jgi:hypothetical protein
MTSLIRHYYKAMSHWYTLQNMVHAILQTHLLALPTKARILCLDSLMNIVAQGILAPR